MIICPQTDANEPADATATHHLLLHENPEWSNLSGASLPRLSWKKAVKWVSVCLSKSIKVTDSYVVR